MTHKAIESGSLALALAILGGAAVLAGCGGGSGHPSSAPTIGALQDHVVNQAATVGPVRLHIAAGADRAADLTVTAVVADSVLVPPRSVLLSGSGTDLALTLLPDPDQTGSTAVTVTVRDAMGRVASRDFVLTVLPVFAPFTQYTTTTFGADANSTPVPVSGLTFQPDADSNVNAFSALVQ